MAITIPSDTKPLQLSRYIVEFPEKTAEAHRRKATLYSLASKVCLVAFTAIAAGAIAISLGLIAPIHSGLIFSLLLSAIPLQFGFQGCMMRSIANGAKARDAEDWASELARIRDWTKPQIEAFFKEHKLSLDKLPISSLSKIERDEPLRALLPALAAYICLRDQTQKLLADHLDNLYNTNANSTFRHQGRLIGWHILESEVFPKALQAALILQIIENPTLQSKLDDIGTCHAKEFDRRRFEQLLDGTDEYFVFKQEGRSPLTFAELQTMIATLDFDAIRAKLFYISALN